MDVLVRCRVFSLRSLQIWIFWLPYQPTAENRAYLKRPLEQKCPFIREITFHFGTGEFGPCPQAHRKKLLTVRDIRCERSVKSLQSKKIVRWSLLQLTSKDIGLQGTMYHTTDSNSYDYLRGPKLPVHDLIGTLPRQEAIPRLARLGCLGCI
jgi:hypothetical protein